MRHVMPLREELTRHGGGDESRASDEKDFHKTMGGVLPVGWRSENGAPRDNHGGVADIEWEVFRQVG